MNEVKEFNKKCEIDKQKISQLLVPLQINGQEIN